MTRFMTSCYGCKNKNTSTCAACIGWSRYESNTLINRSLAMDIDKEMKMLAKAAMNNLFENKNTIEEKENAMKIKNVYFNNPVTVVLWEDGTKTIVKSGEGDIYNPEKGLAMAIAKKALGNKGNYYNIFKKWLPEEVRTVEIEMTSDDILLVQSDGSKVGLKDIASKFTGDENTVVKREVMFTPEELAEKLGVTKATIQKQCREGLHPGAIKVGGKWKIPYEE